MEGNEGHSHLPTLPVPAGRKNWVRFGFSAGCNSAKARAQVREEIAVSLSRTILIGLGLGIVSGISFGEEVPSKNARMRLFCCSR